MNIKIKKPLKKLDNKELVRDIKSFIKNTHKFYFSKIPEINTLAKRLHEEHELKDFYRVFNRLWKSGYHSERILAIHTLKLYEDDFDIETWSFIKQKLKDINDWDELDFISQEIIGIIILKCPSVKKDVFKLSKKTNAYLRRMALISSLPSVRKKEIKFAFELLSFYVKDKPEKIQEAVGIVLNEIGKIDKNSAKKFILKNSKVIGDNAFNIATENLKELRRIRGLKRLDEGKSSFDKRGVLSWIGGGVMR